MLAVQNLSVSFVNAPEALVGVNLSVRAGEIVALSGEPGSGKSALVRCVAGDLTPQAGRITVGGQTVTAGRRQPDHGVSVVWQDLALCDTLDVAANLMLGREPHLGSDSRFYAAATAELSALGIPIRDATALVATLTLEQRRLLALAMALGRRPRVLIVDEMTASPGVLGTATVERLLERAREQGMAVLLVTRDIEQMWRIADRIVVIARGSVAAELEPSSSHRDDIAAMLGEEAAIAHREAASLRRSQELQRQFLSRLSHELRTPLTAIRGYATSLAAPDVTWDATSQQRFLDRIAAESGRLGRLVDDLLDFSAIESGVMRMQPDWCDLRLVIEAAVALLPNEWATSVNVCCDVDVPPIWADHDRLEQVFLNLLSNAFRHNEPGIHVTIEGHQTTGNTVEITVADDGAGFPEALSENPFDSGHRYQSRTAGAGLGLSIAKGIVEAHGGVIALERLPSKGRQNGQVPESAAPEVTVQRAAGTAFQIMLPVETLDEALESAPSV